MNPPKIYIGTAGWHYQDWVGPFYPYNQSPTFDWLVYYSEHFNCVEVNSTFYSYMEPNVVESWVNKTVDVKDFLFTVKLHQDFTHKRIYTSTKISSVKHSLRILKEAGRLGGLLIQFPYSYQFNEVNVFHLQNIVEAFQHFNLFLEVRHKSWQEDSAIDEIKNSNLTFCSIDQPKIGSAIQLQTFITTDKLYVRLHGRNKDSWKESYQNFGKKQSYEEKNERYNYLYNTGELTEISRKIKEQFDQVKEIFIITNNHPQGHAVTNAKELINLLDIKIENSRLGDTLKF